MDYFKHYSTASDGKSMNLIFDKFGHKGIAFWWMLVELCVENWDGITEPEFSFHQRTVVTKLKSSLNSVLTWLELCSNSDLCAFAHSGTQFEIKMPKLKEIKESRGRIKGNKILNPDIYRIDKEEDKDIYKKGKKDEKNLSEISPLNFRNPKDFGFTIDSLQQAWNDLLVGKGKISFCHGLSGSDLHEFSTTVSFKQFQKSETWDELFKRVATSEFLNGSKGTFTATLNWLVKHDNALKVLNGQYSGEKAPSGQTDAYLDAINLEAGA